MVNSDKRNYNIDILKLFSMLMIIILHFLKYGGFLQNSNLNIFQICIVNLLEALCIVAVNVFVLISSYFLQDKKFKIEKVFHIIIDTFVYSVIISFLLMVTGQISFSPKNAFITFFPFLTEQYWFINAYIYLYLLHPFLNFLLTNLKQKQLLILNIFFLIICCFIGMINVDSVFGTVSGMGTVWFVFLYLLTGYLKKYGKKISSIKLFSLYVLGSILLTISSIIIGKMTTSIFGIAKYQFYLYHYNSPVVLLMSLCLFGAFLNLDNSYPSNLKKIIKFCIPSTLSVYILHENIFFRDIIWGLLNFERFGSNLLFLIPFIAFVIFIFGVFIDKIYQLIIGNFLKRKFTELNIVKRAFSFIDNML